MKLVSFLRRRAHLAAAVGGLMVVGSLGLPAASAGAAGVTHLTWQYQAVRPVQGATDRLTGTVTRARVARTVTLQRWSSNAWRTTATTRTSTGRFALGIPTGTAGAARYRVAVPAAGGRGRVVGSSFVVTVQRRATVAATASAYAFLSHPAGSTAPVARWNPCQPIGYRVNLTGAPLGAAAEVTEAVRRVAAATGLTFHYEGTTTLVPTRPASGARFPYPAGTQLVIAWSRPGGTGSYLAGGTSAEVGVGGALWSSGYVDGSGRPALAITQGFVVLDSTKSLTGGFGAGPLTGLIGTRGQLLLHELGPPVGLDHPRVADTSEVMFPVLTHKVASWGTGDLAGLRLLGASQGCLTR
ncbi:MAG: hypothetical protein ACTHJ6_10275 [Oryzihumus sp.]